LHDSAEPEARGLTKIGILLTRTFTSSKHDQHIEVAELVHAALVRSPDDTLDQQKLCIGTHRAPADLQNRDRFVIIPVMHDRFQEVGVSPRWSRLEEASRNDRASFAQSVPGKDLVRGGDHVRLIKQRAAQLRMGGQDARQEMTLSAADIGDMTKLAEIIGVHDGLQGALGVRGHRSIKDRALLGLCGSKIPDRLSIQVLEGDLAGAHAVQQVTPGLPVVGAPDIGGPPRHRRHGMGSKTFAHLCQRKPLIVVLMEDADSSQCP
jgi:hypothetical protein